MLLPKFFRPRFSPVIAANVVLLVILCASATYWTLRLFKAPQRAVSVAPPTPIRTDSAAITSLFGTVSAVASNFQLRGIVLARPAADSVAIIAADGKPARALKTGGEIVAGASLIQIHADHIVISDNGVQKRVPLPSTTLQLTNKPS